MKEHIQAYWDKFWEEKGLTAPKKVDAWQFGSDADELARLVIEGKKRATCSAHIFYEVENVPLPEIGQYSVILNRKDEPVAIIKITDVFILPMNEVPVEFALAEGEGDGTYDYWKNAHVAFFTKELETVGLTFSEDLLLVCERFERVV